MAAPAPPRYFSKSSGRFSVRKDFFERSICKTVLRRSSQSMFFGLLFFERRNDPVGAELGAVAAMAANHGLVDLAVPKNGVQQAGAAAVAAAVALFQVQAHA